MEREIRCQMTDVKMRRCMAGESLLRRNNPLNRGRTDGATLCHLMPVLCHLIPDSYSSLFVLYNGGRLYYMSRGE